MPFLADLDAPPSERGRNLLIGAAIAVPVCLLLGWAALPRVRALMMSAAADHDRLARERDAYMQELCGAGMDIDRDEVLCGCVLATEYPGLDCLDRFGEWLVDRQSERCSAPTTFDGAPGFCSCVQAVAEQTSPLEGEARMRERGAGYWRCRALDDALEPPPLQSLITSFETAEP